jgi:GxxExxY protein
MSENTEYLGNEGYALMGAAFEVHKELGGGLGEEIYQESLELELGFREIPFSSKSELEVYYKGCLLNKKYIPDLLVYSVPSEAT